jgi:redox-sensitive bicupin YhaK (pirin superfamily)
MTARSIKSEHPAHRDDIGDLVTRRPVPGPGIAGADPFLFLNHHGPQIYPPNNNGLPFGPHPHRGFETITFILDGELGHYDSGGHESVIRAGGVQWMTAGSGVIHAELSPPEFKRTGGPMEILQLWVNLPAKLKFAKPAYFGMQREDLPSAKVGEGASAQVISGEIAGVQGPVPSLTGLTMATIAYKAGAQVALAAPQAHTIFFYIVRGAVEMGGRIVKPWQLVEFNSDGDEVAFTAKEDGLVLFGHGAPLNEPVFAHGPFVMNTRDEIITAIHDYQAGKFGPAPNV